MKKVKKQVESNGLLSFEELKLLRGGVMLKNKNTVENCKCTYKDSCSLTNINNMTGCSCECV